MSRPEPSPDRFSRWTWTVCLILLSATLLNYANRFAFTQNAAAIKEAFDTGDDGYGLVAGRFSLGFACGGLLFGILADWISVRRLYPLVVIVWSLAGISSGVVSSLVGLGAARFVLGLFEAGHWPCALRTTQRVFKPAQRTWANSILQAGASLGAFGTPLLVEALRVWDPEQWRLVFYIVGGFGLPWALWWLFTVSEEDVRRPVIQTDESSHGPGRDQQLQEVPFWMVFTTRRWWILLWVVICINTLWHFVRVWMPVILKDDYGYSDRFINYFVSAYFAATFFGSLASGGMNAWLAQRGWNVHRARLFVFLLFASISSLVIPVALMPAGGLALRTLRLGLLLLVGFGSLGLFPVYYSLNQEISARNQGKVGGSLGFSTWMVLAVFHPILGDWFEKFPEYRPYLFAVVGMGPLLAFGGVGDLLGPASDVREACRLKANGQPSP